MKWEQVRYFKPAEFACKCGCGRGAEEMNEQFVMALDAARKEAGIPFRIKSGFRCAKHNLRVGGVKDSSHTRGLAVDIAVPSSTARLIAVRALMRYFERIGVGGSFVHVDMDPDKQPGVMWVY